MNCGADIKAVDDAKRYGINLVGMMRELNAREKETVEEGRGASLKMMFTQSARDPNWASVWFDVHQAHVNLPMIDYIQISYNAKDDISEYTLGVGFLILHQMLQGGRMGWGLFPETWSLSISKKDGGNNALSIFLDPVFHLLFCFPKWISGRKTGAIHESRQFVRCRLRHRYIQEGFRNRCREMLPQKFRIKDEIEGSRTILHEQEWEKAAVHSTKTLRCRTYKRSDTSVISLWFLRLSRRAFISTSETLDFSTVRRLLVLSREDVVPGPTKWSMFLKSTELRDDHTEDGLELM